MSAARVPVIRLWQRLVVPLQGDITDEVAAVLLDDILQGIRENKAQGLVVDVTGVWSIDSHLCFTLSKIADAARLMGTPTVICGLSASIAMTLEAMGASFQGVELTLSLEDALGVLGVSPRFHSTSRVHAASLLEDDPLRT